MAPTSVPTKCYNENETLGLEVIIAKIANVRELPDQAIANLHCVVMREIRCVMTLLCGVFSNCWMQQDLSDDKSIFVQVTAWSKFNKCTTPLYGCDCRNRKSYTNNDINAGWYKEWYIAFDFYHNSSESVNPVVELESSPVIYWNQYVALSRYIEKQIDVSQLWKIKRCSIGREMYTVFVFHE